MPIYEYQCEKCEKVSEVFQKISDPAPEKCDSCGGKLKKLISESSFHLKGGGWYKDLYSSKKPESKDSKKDTPKKETKPEKKETKPKDKKKP